MSRGWGIVIAGLCALAVLIAAWVLPHRTKSKSRANTQQNVGTSSKTATKTSSQIDADKRSADVLRPDDPMLEPRLDMEVLAMEAELELVTPLEQGVVQYARVTANMSLAQMADMQNLRQEPVVRNMNGNLKSPYAEAKKCNARNICKTTIINTHSKEIVWDGNWVRGYRMTGVGMEVVKLGNKG